MIRNSSFFWASDDWLRDDEDEAPTFDSDDGLNDIHNISRTHARSASDLSGEFNRPFESTELIDKRLDYGAANDVNVSEVPVNFTGRRKLFRNSLTSKNNNGAHALPNRGNVFPASPNNTAPESIRFQVVIWHIGEINVQGGHVKMRFRITLFWNDNQIHNDTTTSSPSPSKTRSQNGVWIMEGRQNAYLKEFHHNQESSIKEIIDVPPVSILNAVELDTVSPPEITMLNSQTRSMRWTCMYNATLSQGDHMSVKDFPHDNHQLKLKIGILAHRNKGGRWDHTIYTLALATEQDSQGSTSIPHGLVVDHCAVPDFAFNKDALLFDFCPLMFGGNERDVYLQVTLPVFRQSQHYDCSILPMLIMLNVIAVSCLTRNFASATAATEIMLSIAFVQVGIRLTLDSRLPSVGYQIKMQKVMNCCFWLLSGLVLESNLVFFLVTKMGWEISDTDSIDLATAFIALCYNGYILRIYFYGKVENSLVEVDEKRPWH